MGAPPTEFMGRGKITVEFSEPETIKVGHIEIQLRAVEYSVSLRGWLKALGYPVTGGAQWVNPEGLPFAEEAREKLGANP